MKKVVIAVVIIGGLAAYWFSTRSDGSGPKRKAPINNIAAGLGDDVDPEKEENTPEMSKTEAYQQDYYEAEVKKRKQAERQQQKDNMNVVAYSFNNSLDNPDDYTIVGAEEEVEEEPKNIGTMDMTSPIPDDTKPVAKPTTRKKRYKKKSTTTSKPQPQKVVESKPEPPVREAATFNSSSFNSSSFNSSSSTSSAQNGNNQAPQRGRNDIEGETTPIIDAVVYGDHNITNGEPVRFRIRETVMVSGVKIPRNTIFSAPSSFSGRRLQVNITSIPAPDGRNIPTNLTVYDLDHLKGIAININTEGQAAKESGSNVTRDILRDATRSTMVGNAATSLVNQISRGEIKIDVSQGHEVTLRINQ